MARQIEDQEYDFLQGRRQVADFVESIYNDPQLNKQAKALIKAKYPGLQIPDYDLENKIEARFAQEKQARDAEETKKRRAAEDEQWKQKRKSTQDQYGFTEDAMKRLEKMMVERNIGDYEAGAALMAQKEPKTTEPTHDSHYWRHEKQDGFNEIAKDPEGWARNEILKSIRADQAKGER